MIASTPSVLVNATNPLRSAEIRSSGISCRTLLFGNSWMGKPVDWRLPNKEVSPASAEAEQLSSRMSMIAAAHNIREVYAPYTDRNSENPSELIDYTDSQQIGAVSFRRGPQADIVIVRNRSAVVAFMTAGCALLVAIEKGKVAIAHAGLKSLLNPGLVRQKVSVVDVLQKEFGVNAGLWVYFAIRPERFVYSETDPKFGELNKKWRQAMIREGCPEAMDSAGRIDLVAIIRQQVKRAGFLDRPARGPDVYLPSGAHDQASGGRNLVLFQIGR